MTILSPLLKKWVEQHEVISSLTQLIMLICYNKNRLYILPLILVDFRKGVGNSDRKVETERFTLYNKFTTTPTSSATSATELQRLISTDYDLFIDMEQPEWWEILTYALGSLSNYPKLLQ